MKILLIHNRYQQYGGEDSVYNQEKMLLQQRGHTVTEYVDDNRRIRGFSRLTVAPQSIWSQRSYNDLKDLIQKFHPDIAHLHNFFPLISPSAYYACSSSGVPTVQTLHNYRILCPTATFFRDNHVCEDCLGRTFPWPGVLHACYRDSRIQTSAAAMMIGVHNLIKTWHRKVGIFIALTQFSREKFIQGGISADKVVVKPNFFSPDPGKRKIDERFAIYVGRLSPEKGIKTLLEAWNSIPGIPLKIVGSGVLNEEVQKRIEASPQRNVEMLGMVGREEVIDLMKRASFLVYPSACYENIPTAIIEAYACGLPVIASRLGAMQEIVDDKQSGLLVDPNDPFEWAAKINWAGTHKADMAEMGLYAREKYEKYYTAERNYHLLMDIYKRLI